MISISRRRGCCVHGFAVGIILSTALARYRRGQQWDNRNKPATGAGAPRLPASGADSHIITIRRIIAQRNAAGWRLLPPERALQKLAAHSGSLLAMRRHPVESRILSADITAPRDRNTVHRARPAGLLLRCFARAVFYNGS